MCCWKYIYLLQLPCLNKNPPDSSSARFIFMSWPSIVPVVFTENLSEKFLYLLTFSWNPCTHYVCLLTIIQRGSAMVNTPQYQHSQNGLKSFSVVYFKHLQAEPLESVSIFLIFVHYQISSGQRNCYGFLCTTRPRANTDKYKKLK